MTNKNRNKSLFYYGLKARIIIFLGSCICLSGFIVLFWSILIGVILMGMGMVIILNGKSREYDYKRQGGHIIYTD